MFCDIRVISGYKLLCQGRNGCLFYKKGRLYLADAPEQKPRLLTELKSSPFRTLLTRIRLTERLFRMEPRLAVPMNDGFLLSWSGAMHFVDVNMAQVHRLHNYRRGMNNPLGITKLENIPGFTDGYVYGEYWGNTERAAVCLYRMTGQQTQCVYTFLPGQILHIHGIAPDALKGRVLICTGDRDAESAIWAAYDDFKTVIPLVQGAQCYRTCAAHPTQSGILYATDTPLEDNGIYFYSEETKKLQRLFDMPGPCIYSKRVARPGKPDLFVFATSVEPDPTLPYWRYRFTYRLGAGVKNRWVHLIAGNPQEGFKTLCCMKKDGLPMLLFQFGNCTFPDTPLDAPLLCTPVSVNRYDGKTLCIELGE